MPAPVRTVLANGDAAGRVSDAPKDDRVIPAAGVDREILHDHDIGRARIEDFERVVAVPQQDLNLPHAREARGRS
jgi:hypothetical protein